MSRCVDDKRYDVVVVGGTLIDLTAYISRMPGRGETLIGSEFKQGFGGKGCNQAVMAKLLGSRAVIAGCMGNDNFGNDFRYHLEKEGVESIMKTAPDGVSTGVALITVTEDGQNHIAVVFGANNALTVDDVLQEGSPIHEAVVSARVVVCQFEIPLSVVEVTLDLGRSSGAFVILNPAPIPNNLKGIPESVFRMAHIVCPNEVEAGLLCGLADSGRSIREIAEICLKRLTDLGCALPMVTMGAEGVLVCDSDGERHHLPAPKVKAFDTTGAGDCFVGSLAHFLALSLKKGQSASDKDPLLRAVKRAIHLASQSVTKSGSQSSFPRGEELEAILKEME